MALGVKMQDGNCVKAGGIVVQPMPNCSEEEIFILQDIVSNFTDVASLLCEKALRRYGFLFLSLRDFSFA